MRCHAVSGVSLDSQTRQPPFLMRSNGFVCVNAVGSQQSTTSTWFSSQFTLIGSRATVRYECAGAAFCAEPYFGFAVKGALTNYYLTVAREQIKVNCELNHVD